MQSNEIEIPRSLEFATIMETRNYNIRAGRLLFDGQFCWHRPYSKLVQAVMYIGKHHLGV